ncbi:UDP-N-acetylmuramoyl-L-alanyl-D-glutamate--2,6-diaminopimelate ligase [Bifidobacterium vespertilionis]|uniref:UDP-N-acetylmuramoyl-L-alanyl-D-glutamate--2, 6-diaminopimelate ligase n=1 Tax=Bifidobacterium vespertilionis TaxID=2562524 RepID=A0A5J5E3V0_9BIFI|nr:UDP-N-acetylmuramoyl-L-alanyl-D-glutamate--2,6-diaminopimelate ligase [Bifidobacterium vespertilionis]KAA8817006.1 UDP-N-acetylmuramoyl-L-alanyl-D-glutamate--2,6-diaminopimelate ligase [Bifidobacterium vespertilionis]KAA8823778.1 UDP-N-acetylmuramoyl-L-alanyl-D-glutamate--2,6-diaminopimelate ligase [Bifidobacterium vespertilionis]
MALTLASAAELLRAHHLLREIIHGDAWTLDPARVEGSDVPFADVTYDTRTVEKGSLLFCKGNFKAAYLDGVDAKGLAAYVAETDLSDATKAPGLIVDDARKAMSLLSAAFFGRPQDELTVVGITGTKGKTTTAYFTQAILNAASEGRAALFSSVDNCLDGHTYKESDLTTPESLDAFRMMREAANNGMKYLVMEVSSQAYKVDRVYGLTFDVGAFLNISPDHISPIEHPTFEDYLNCKRRITANSRTLVLGADCAHADLIREDAAAANVPVTTFALHNAGRDEGTPADVIAWPANADHSAYDLASDGAELGAFRLALDGDFNYANAAAAIAIAHAAGVPLDDATALHAIEPITIAGRMERFEDPQSNTIAIVDYAHNFASVTALIDFVYERYGKRDPRITLVTGSAGNKAVDRRKEIVEAAEHRIANFVFTAEDTNTEPFIDICMEMQGYITDPNVTSTVISDRGTAITNAVYDARAHADRFNVLLLIGKGNERWIKDRNRHVPYEGDDHVIERLFGLNQK